MRFRLVGFRASLHRFSLSLSLSLCVCVCVRVCVHVLYVCGCLGQSSSRVGVSENGQSEEPVPPIALPLTLLIRVIRRPLPQPLSIRPLLWLQLD